MIYHIRLQIFLHSIVSTRMILNLRECSGQTDETQVRLVYPDASTENQD